MTQRIVETPAATHNSHKWFEKSDQMRDPSIANNSKREQPSVQFASTMAEQQTPTPRRKGVLVFPPTEEIGCCCGNQGDVQDQHEAFIQRIINTFSDGNSIVETVRSIRSRASPRNYSSPAGLQPVSSSILFHDETSGNWKTALLGILGIMVLVIALPAVVLRIITRERPLQDNNVSLSGQASSSSPSVSSPFQPEIDPFRHDLWDIMKVQSIHDVDDATSLAISSDGSVLVVASALKFSVMERDDEDLWSVSYTEVLPISNGQPTVELSGDGSTVFLGATNTSLPILVWRATEGWKQPLVPRSSVQLQKYMEDESSFLLVDIAASYDGHTCIVGYGTDATEELLFYKDQTVITMHMPKALTMIFEFSFGIWNERRIPSEQIVNNFGYQVAMDDKGLIGVRTSEQEKPGVSSPPLYHMANRIAHSVESWIGQFDSLTLVTVDECPDVDADIGISSDGATIVAVLQCWKQNGYAVHIIRTFTDLLFGAEDGTRKDIPSRSNHRFSMEISGDATTMVMDMGDGKLNWLEQVNGTWSDPEELFSQPTDTTLDFAVSEDGSIIAVAGLDEKGLLLYKRKAGS